MKTAVSRKQSMPNVLKNEYFLATDTHKCDELVDIRIFSKIASIEKKMSSKSDLYNFPVAKDNERSRTEINCKI